jgi:hypothetical protein
MATSTKPGGGTGDPNVGRSALTFEEFVDTAIGAAIRAAARHGGTPGKPGHLPWPIWVGIIAGPFDKGQFGGGGPQQ